MQEAVAKIKNLTACNDVCGIKLFEKQKCTTCSLLYAI